MATFCCSHIVVWMNICCCFVLPHLYGGTEVTKSDVCFYLKIMKLCAKSNPGSCDLPRSQTYTTTRDFISVTAQSQSFRAGDYDGTKFLNLVFYFY